MERLIRSCFLHVEIIGDHVVAGRYDLMIVCPSLMERPLNASNFGFPPPTEMPRPPEFQTPPAPTPNQELTPSLGVVSPGSTSQTYGNTPIAQEASPAASTTAAASSGQVPLVPTPPPVSTGPLIRDVYVLPELWEDTIEPGMEVVQHMWPLSAPPSNPAPPPPPPPGMGGGLNMGGRGVPGPGPGRGRGRGRGRGGQPPPPPPPQWAAAPPPPQPPGVFPPHRPPGRVPIEVYRPRGKTRKRREVR